MKKWISMVLAVIMLLTLAPFSAFADGPRKNGPAAFDRLVSIAKQGKYKDGDYRYTFKNTSSEFCSIVYKSEEDEVSINCTLTDTYYASSELMPFASITIPRSLSMPYTGCYLGVGTDGKMSWASPDLDSSFVTPGSLSLNYLQYYGSPGHSRVYTMLLKVLTYTQSYFFDGTYYSVGDLGFTAFADDRGLAYDVDVPSGWVKDAGKWYYIENGAAATGWKKISSVWYYFNNSGVMQTGWQKIGGAWYYFASGGAMQTGWQKINNVWYYFASGGQMQTGWRDIGGKTYYFKPSGAMAANEWCNGWWLNADGSWTYPYKGSWKQDAKGWWFGDTSGWYARNTKIKINDKLYTFNAAGYMV